MVHARLRDGSLRAAATENGATMLLYEGGEAWRFDTQAIDVGVRGIRRVLSELGMIDRDADDADTMVPMESRRTSWVRARRSGLALLQTGLGAEVTAGTTPRCDPRLGRQASEQDHRDRRPVS